MLLDKNLKPWLLEVNIFPSLRCSSPLDKITKTKLLCDTLTLIGIKGYDKEKMGKIPKEKLKKAFEQMSFKQNKMKPNTVLEG